MRIVEGVTTFADGLAMGESARWHDGSFWCSDWVAGEILRFDPGGTPTVVARSTSFPFCFDWTGDGTLLVTSSSGLERLDGSALVPFADLTGLAEAGGWNEVVVDPVRGNAYVNAINFDMSGGFDFEVGSRSGVVAVVTPDGESRLVADELAFPNGMAVTPDGSTLIAAESFTSRLSAWDIEDDGSLTNRRVWAQVDNGVDGISLDASGGVWCATQKGAARVERGGEVTDIVESDLFGFSCVLGGADGKTLYLVVAEWNGPEGIGQGPRTGRVDAVSVT